jgi:diguanylate cyclase
VRRESLTDSLTGIANRKHFEETLIKAVSRAGRASLAAGAARDRHRPFQGVQRHLRAPDRRSGAPAGRHHDARERQANATLARFGGEEFGIILPETTIEDAARTAEQIRVSVMSRELVKRSTGEPLGRVTVSVGLATFRPDDNANSLLERADDCMYTGQAHGPEPDRHRRVAARRPRRRRLSVGAATPRLAARLPWPA